ncbi:hypothetical protein Srufu_058060 [Streptomyces libani subsp. rufus]|nr:hypothetical protein Srufu_058060 [Streptomyces libani subsp. rufus]
MQLVAGELDGEDVVRGLAVLALPQDDIDDRRTDVADGQGAQSLGGQDRGQHPHGGGLAVGAGDPEPGRGARAPQPPGDLHIADDVDARRSGRREQRAVRLPAGRGDDEFGALGERVTVAEADRYAVRRQFPRGGALLVAVAAVHDGDVCAEAGQRAGGTDAAHAQAGDGDVLTGEVRRAVRGHFAACQPP